MIKLIIFDVDGVIIDAHPAYFACYHQALQSVGVTLDQEVEKRIIIQKWGKGYEVQLRALLKEYPQFLPKAIENYLAYRHSDKFSSEVSLIKGVHESLEALSKKYILAAATGLRRRYLDEYIKRYHLNYFKRTMTLDDIDEEDNYKPSPYMLFEYMKFFGVTKDEVVYVGDAENDVLMAKGAEVTPIVVLTGHLDKEEAKELGVKHIIPDITYLGKLLNEI